MFSTCQQCWKPGKSPTRELPAPSHFALQRWHVCLLFFPFSSLLASLYTLNCTESFDGGWEGSECRVEEKRNWALTLIRWRASEKKKVCLSTLQAVLSKWTVGSEGGGQKVYGTGARQVQSCRLRDECNWWEQRLGGDLIHTVQRARGGWEVHAC